MMDFFSMIKVLLLCTTSLSLLAIPASGQISSTNNLLTGERLNTNEYLKQYDYKFTIQDDCNLVLYRLTRPLWSSDTNHQGVGCYLTLLGNGNLVIYDSRNKIVWTSKTNGQNGNYILILQRDGKVVIYGPSVWSTGKNSYGSDDVVVATALDGTTGVSGEEQNNVREMGKIMEVMRDE